MKKYEYKTIEMELEGSSFLSPSNAPGFEELLNKQGAEGWRYVDTIVETVGGGKAVRFKIVFEKEID